MTTTHRSTILQEVEDTPLEHLAAPHVVIDGDIVEARRLSLDQTLGLARLVLRAASKMGESERRELEIAAKAGSMDGNLAPLFLLLEKETIVSVFSLLMDRDEAWVKAHWHLARYAEFVAKLSILNDPQDIWGAFQQVVKGWRPRSTNLSQP